MKTYNILSINEFKTNIENNSRLLGIDPGNKNIGFAICDENKKVATPLKIIQKTKFEVLIKKINEIIQENNVKGFFELICNEVHKHMRKHSENRVSIDVILFNFDGKILSRKSEK